MITGRSRAKQLAMSNTPTFCSVHNEILSSLRAFSRIVANSSQPFPSKPAAKHTWHQIIEKIRSGLVSNIISDIDGVLYSGGAICGSSPTVTSDILSK